MKKKDKCFYCDLPLTDENRTKDHVLPRSKWGAIEKNKIYCCRACNQAKGDLYLESFIKTPYFQFHCKKNENNVKSLMNLWMSERGFKTRLINGVYHKVKK